MSRKSELLCFNFSFFELIVCGYLCFYSWFFCQICLVSMGVNHSRWYQPHTTIKCDGGDLLIFFFQRCTKVLVCNLKERYLKHDGNHKALVLNINSDFCFFLRNLHWTISVYFLELQWRNFYKIWSYSGVLGIPPLFFALLLLLLTDFWFSPIRSIFQVFIINSCLSMHLFISNCL